LLGWGLALVLYQLWLGLAVGFLIIPMMYDFLNMPLKLAIGTSSATVVITALFSVAGYVFNGMGRADLPEWSFGFVDLWHGAALAFGSLLMARVGAYVSFRTHPYRLRKLFAFFIILISIYMLVK
jgi:uncharacterized membrane protein YfcA